MSGGSWHGGYCPESICSGVYDWIVFVRGVFVLEPSRMYSQRHQLKSELSVKQMLWMGARKMFRSIKCISASE